MRCSSCLRSVPVSDAVRIATPLADAPRPVTLTQRASLNVIASLLDYGAKIAVGLVVVPILVRSEEHTSELQSHHDLVCRLLLEKKNFIVAHFHYITVRGLVMA